MTWTDVSACRENLLTTMPSGGCNSGSAFKVFAGESAEGAMFLNTLIPADTFSEQVVTGPSAVTVRLYLLSGRAASAGNELKSWRETCVS